MMRAAVALVALLCAPRVVFASFEVPPFEPVAVSPRVPAYEVKPDLSNVVNLEQFGELTPRQRELLAKNAFFVAPADDKQLYFVYENNDYLVVPSFVTSDAVLQLYHIFYDYSLREVEAERLIPAAERLTEHMLSQFLSMYSALPPGGVREACLKNVAYFGVAASLLGLSPDLPPAASHMVEAELATIAEHEDREMSAVFPYKFDFSQFIPRGHYTRSDELKRYFRAMMWYGLVPFALEWPPPYPRGVCHEQIRQSLLITRILHTTRIDGTPAIDLWERIYEPTAFYVGFADDLTPAEWRAAAEKVWGHLPRPDELAETKRLD
jgi:hypothetical protein